MNKGILFIATLLGALAVILGAFAAHGLKQIVPLEVIAIFETGVRYQFYHVFALLAVGIMYKEFANDFLIWTARLFLTGIFLFSGSLYLLTFLKGHFPPGYEWLALITPLGGLCFIAGWLAMALAIKSKK